MNGDHEAEKTFMLEYNKKQNRRLPWRERIPTKTLKQVLDATNAAPKRPFVLTGKPLNELVREIEHIGSKLQSNIASTDEIQRYTDIWGELLLRDMGLHDILCGIHDSEHAERRIAKLCELFDGMDVHALSVKLQEQVPELPWYEIERIFEFSRFSVTRYFGNANDSEEFLEWVVQFLVNEARKRAFLHLVIREHSGVVYDAIVSQLDKVSDLCSPDDREELFWEILELAWERFAESLQEPGSAKLSTRLYRLALKCTRNYTKTLTDQAAIRRKNPTVFPQPPRMVPAIAFESDRPESTPQVRTA
jgi:hypothetical protein